MEGVKARVASTSNHINWAMAHTCGSSHPIMKTFATCIIFNEPELTSIWLLLTVNDLRYGSLMC